MGTKTVLKIDIYTDVTCPWCYLGKRQMEKALEVVQLKELEVRYLPFELRPDTPVEGVDRMRTLQAKYGPGIRANDARITELGQKVGLDFHFEKAATIPNTFNAHRVIWLAGNEGVQKAVVEALHEAYFTRGKNIGDKMVLEQVAVSAGLDAEKVKHLLNSDEGVKEVRELERNSMDLGITGVPFFVFNNETAVSGAQPVEAFVSIFKSLLS